MPLSAVVMGNPSTTDEVTIEIRGASGKAVRLDLTNNRGQVIGRQSIVRATLNERRVVKLNSQPGIYYLRVMTADDRYTVKILRR